MKKLYIKPVISVLNLNTEVSVLTGSSITVGNTWGAGDEVLSRQRGSNNSLWDDEEAW